MSSVLISLKVSIVLVLSGTIFAVCCKSDSKEWLLRRAILVSPALFSIVMVTQSVFILYCSVLISIPILARSKVEAACLYPIVLLSIPNIPYDVRIAGSAITNVDAWRFAGLGFLIAVLSKPRRTYSLSFSYSAYTGLITVIFIVALPGIRGANFTSALRYLSDITLTYAIPYAAMLLSLNKPKDIQSVFMAFAFAVSCQVGIALYQSHEIWPIYEDLYPRLGLANPATLVLKMRGNSMRATGVILESTSLSLLFGFGFIAVFSLKKIFKSKTYHVAGMTIMVSGMISTMARSGFVFVAVAIPIMLIFKRQGGRALISVICAGFIYIVGIIGSSYSTRLANLTGSTIETTGTVDYRKELLRRGWETILNHPFGINGAQANIELADLRQGEGIIDFVNGYIYAGVYGGIPSMILLLLIFLVPSSKLFAARGRLGNLTSGIDAGSMLAGLFLAMAISSFTSGFGGPLIIVLSTFMAISALVLAMASQQTQQSNLRQTSINDHPPE